MSARMCQGLIVTGLRRFEHGGNVPTFTAQLGSDLTHKRETCKATM